MALSNGNGNNGSSSLIILKPVNKDENKNKVEPYFSVTRKVDGKWKTGSETFNKVSGSLSKVEVKEQEFNKVKYKTVGVYLKDGEETYLLDLRFSITTRNLFNMLATLTAFDNLSVSYYQDKNGYDRFSLRQNDAFVNWKYSAEQLPKPIEVTFKGAVQRDYTPIDEIFEKELVELNARVSSGKPAKSKPASTPAPAASDAGDKDVPF
jgi:hypothetical protein